MDAAVAAAFSRTGWHFHIKKEQRMVLKAFLNRKYKLTASFIECLVRHLSGA